MSIALGISSIAYNESILSASAREAHHSFFAADSGVECALAYESDIVNGVSFSCAGNIPANNPILVTANPPLYSFYEQLVDGDHCAYVVIEKNVSLSNSQNPSSSSLSTSTTLGTHIISHGYNISCTDVQNSISNPTNPLLKKMVERVIEITY